MYAANTNGSNVSVSVNSTPGISRCWLHSMIVAKTKVLGLIFYSEITTFVFMIISIVTLCCWNNGIEAQFFCFLLPTLLCCLSELTACFGCVGFVGCFILFQEELLKCCCGLGFNLSLLLALKKKKMTNSADNDSELRSLLNDLFVSPVCWDPCMYLFGDFFLRSIPCSSLDIGHWITSRKCCNMLQVNLLFKASIVQQGTWKQLSQSNVCL